MRFFTIDTREHDYIRLEVAADGSCWVPVRLDGQLVSGIPLSYQFSEGARQIGLSGIQRGVLREQDDERPYIMEERRTKAFTAAVILIQTPPGKEGIRLTQGTYDEYVNNGRVQRQYHEFMLGGDPPPGVRILASNELPDIEPDNPEWLLHLLPNATFRIERLGGVDDGPELLEVRWSGQRLTVRALELEWHGDHHTVRPFEDRARADASAQAQA